MEVCTKLIQKNGLPSMAHESQFSDKQKFHSAPKQRCPVSTKVLSSWLFILWLQRTASCAWSFTLLSRECSTTWYEIMHLPMLGNLPILDSFPLCGLRLQSRTSWTQCKSAKRFTIAFHSTNIRRCMFNHLVLKLSAHCYLQQTRI